MLRFFEVILVLLCLILYPVSAQSQEEKDSHDIFEEIDDLNLGLPNFESIALSNLSTPEQSLSYFVSHCREGRYDQAAYVLNLNLIDPRQRAGVGPELARKLYQVMDRQTGFPFDKAPDRLDGQLPPSQSSDTPMGGRPRKSILLDSVEDLDEAEDSGRCQEAKTQVSASLHFPSLQERLAQRSQNYADDRNETGLQCSRRGTERRVSPTGGTIPRLGPRA